MTTISFVSGCAGVTYEHRVVGAARACESLGLVTKLHAPRPDGTCDAEGVLRDLDCDGILAVICHRVQISPSLERVAQRCRTARTALVYDADDLIFDSAFACLFERLGIGSRDALDAQVVGAVRAAGLCDFSWCSTPEIGRGLTRLGIPHVSIVPNTFSEATLAASDAALRCRPATGAARPEVVIGFGSGSRTHAFDLVTVAEPMARILDRFPFVHLCLVGGEPLPPALDAYRERINLVARVPYEDLPAVMAGWDVNIAPLERTGFTEAKSALKYIDAALVEVPTVATATEPFRDAIQDRVTGRLIAGDEWYEALADLVVDPVGCRALGQAARADVLRRFGPQTKRRAIAAALAAVREASDVFRHRD